MNLFNIFKLLSGLSATMVLYTIIQYIQFQYSTNDHNLSSSADSQIKTDSGIMCHKAAAAAGISLFIGGGVGGGAVIFKLPPKAI